MMAFELMTEGFDEAWVDALSPARLRHFYSELIRNRSARQREHLHIQVSAAAVIADGGKLAKSHDQTLAALSDARPDRTVRDDRGSGRAETLDQAAQVQRSVDETAHMWKK